ncbi:hypothetical protein MTYP_02725 [Methylophilaceae bacterium]|nr:hypothetical protein MTYP_02725 [Methylophilaceae bacterium]
MNIDNVLLLNFLVALGIGLLVGAERERNSQAAQNGTAIAGVRTFTIASLLGAISITVNFWLLVVTLVCVTIFSATAYFVRKDDDPGLTTEITLILTVILGGLAMSTAALAASLAVSVAIILAAKEPLHGFVKGVVTKNELNDFLVLAAATLIVLPLVPNAFIGPYDAINPRNLWLIVILVMFISALGHLALRLFGGRVGLPIVGLASGFISSIATIGAMGERAKQEPEIKNAAVAGAVLSNVSTILQLALLLAAINTATLRALAFPLILGGASAVFFGAAITLKSLNQKTAELTGNSRSFSVKTALMLAALIGFVLFLSAALNDWLGHAGLVIASGAAGLADTHSPAISVATMVSTGKLDAEAAAIPILVAFTLNSVSKAITAFVSGGKDFSLSFIPALMTQVLMIWAGWWLF